MSGVTHSSVTEHKIAHKHLSPWGDSLKLSSDKSQGGIL